MKKIKRGIKQEGKKLKDETQKEKKEKYTG